MKPGAILLPSPSVRFAPDFLARVGRLVARLASQRERREGAGSARLFGVGSEFVGFRPYRAGEDLRALDWNLLARLGRPYVRVSAREASEDWSVVLDTSASMGVGVPGKLQLGAELATALAALGLARGATVALRLTGSERRVLLRKRAGLAEWMAALEATRAEGRAGTAGLAAALAAERGAGRLFVVGDFLEDDARALCSLARPSRELFLAQILAAVELSPGPRAGVRWVDAESGAEREMVVDAGRAASYERRLEARIRSLARAARRARAVHAFWSSETPFEDALSDLGAGQG